MNRSELVAVVLCGCLAGCGRGGEVQQPPAKTISPSSKAPVAGDKFTAALNDQPLPGLSAVLDDLRRGGLVVYFRHAITEQAGATDEASDLARCETQRNLSAAGRAQSEEIGKAIRSLRIPVGAVEASPFCRTRDTAQLAFGRFEAKEGLYFVISTDAAQTQRLAAALRKMLSTPPAQGTNTILVSHSANLREAAGIFAKPEGAAYVFRPLPDGRFEPIAKILPEDWSRAAKADSARPGAGTGARAVP
jgi:broad specificity phosphatase PhoE/predicted small lipoprotein YifL